MAFVVLATWQLVNLTPIGISSTSVASAPGPLEERAVARLVSSGADVLPQGSASGIIAPALSQEVLGAIFQAQLSKQDHNGEHTTSNPSTNGHGYSAYSVAQTVNESMPTEQFSQAILSSRSKFDIEA